VQEVAAVGLGEESALKRGFRTITALSSVPAELQARRIAKVIAEEATGRVIGVQLVGPGSVEAIHTATLALHAGVTLDELAHPAWLDGTMCGALATAAAATGRGPLSESTVPIVGGED